MTPSAVDKARNALGATAVGVIAETPSLIVTTTADVVADDGETSLREAIGFVNDGTVAAGSTITFANGAGDAFEEGGLILLGGAELSIREGVTIDGNLDDDAAPDLTIDADERSRVFRVDDRDATTDLDVTLDGLVITGGKAPREILGDEPSEAEGTFRGGGNLSSENMAIVASSFVNNDAAQSTYFGVGCGGAIFSSGKK